MSDIRLIQTSLSAMLARSSVDPLRGEYDAWQTLFEAQPGLVQRFIEAQGRVLAEALGRREAGTQLRFNLPDQVVVAVPTSGAGQLVLVPPEFREQLAGGLIDR